MKYYKIKPSFCAEQSRRFGQTGAPWAGSLRPEDRQAAKLSGGQFWALVTQNNKKSQPQNRQGFAIAENQTISAPPAG
ncbi:MAG: hypothetical protein DU429_08645 [Candidatus Tokpelaia sp.]|nr:MAG: hypothetical protein DU429_08645 [Candidatus Tokpelaia sp.]KAA6206523.1 MAG: hypothetical protein DU430_00010 [Candidatus Tokpelaia sp.]